MYMYIYTFSYSFRFDETALKTLSASNDSLNRAVEDDPIHLGDEEATSTPCEDDPYTSEVKLRDRRKVEHRKSAPPTHNRSMRDSVGSLDYLSETQVDQDSDDEESVQSEVLVHVHVYVYVCKYYMYTCTKCTCTCIHVQYIVRVCTVDCLVVILHVLLVLM